MKQLIPASFLFFICLSTVLIQPLRQLTVCLLVQKELVRIRYYDIILKMFCGLFFFLHIVLHITNHHITNPNPNLKWFCCAAEFPLRKPQWRLKGRLIQEETPRGFRCPRLDTVHTIHAWQVLCSPYSEMLEDGKTFGSHLTISADTSEENYLPCVISASSCPCVAMRLKHFPKID